jgi:uncharacterized protein YcfJ
MGFRKMASSALDFMKDVPNKAINKGMGYVNSEAILDKVQDTASYANTRLLERSITNGENSASRLKSPLHRGARQFQKVASGLEASDIDMVARSAIGSATAGALSGAAGGMLSEDQSVVGGALTGGILGGLAGGGMQASRLFNKKNLPNNIQKSNGRLRDLRAKADKMDAHVGPEKTAWSSTKLKDMGKTYRRNSRIDNLNDRRANVRSGLTKQISAEEAAIGKKTSGLTEPVRAVNPWLVGGLAGGGTLAHSMLTANQPLQY